LAWVPRPTRIATSRLITRNGSLNQYKPDAEGAVSRDKADLSAVLGVVAKASPER